MKQKLKSRQGSLLECNVQLSKNLKQVVSELNSKKFVDGLKLGVYSPIQNEPIWWESFLKDSVDDYLLVHMNDDHSLSYHLVDFEKIRNAEFGLKLDCSLINKNIEPDIILIPGLAYTRQFGRLGRGKGYFDRYLSHFKGVKIGVFYSIQEVENVFDEVHDEELDYIITEKEIIIRG